MVIYSGCFDNELPSACPRLSPQLIGTDCDEARASELGALLYNRSKISVATVKLP